MTMNYRPLGGTGIQVSVHCLGAMMFGAAGSRVAAPWLHRCYRHSDTNGATMSMIIRRWHYGRGG
jgi:aryl-alcohol dehydrogenase-like predicted oxidoreductase